MIGIDKVRLSVKDLNESSCTIETVTTSFSEDVDECAEDQYYPNPPLRIDDFLWCDYDDSTSQASVPSILDDMEDENSIDGPPRDIFVLHEDACSIAEESDIHQRLHIAETLAYSFKAKMKSTEELTDTLYEYLKQAQTYSEDVLADRNKLLQEIELMQEEEQSQIDQRMFLKLIMASCLCYYMCGGSPFFLTCSVILNLLADAVMFLF